MQNKGSPGNGAKAIIYREGQKRLHFLSVRYHLKPNLLCLIGRENLTFSEQMTHKTVLRIRKPESNAEDIDPVNRYEAQFWDLYFS